MLNYLGFTESSDKFSPRPYHCITLGMDCHTLKKARTSDSPRTTDVAFTFKVHQPGQDAHDYGPIKLELLTDFRVRSTQNNVTYPPHGSWALDPQSDTFSISWHWQSNIHKIKQQIFAKVQCTKCWERINCDPGWVTILLPWDEQ